MPRKSKVFCKQQGCPHLVEVGQRLCDEHKRLHQCQQDQRRGNSYRRGYDRKWQRVRAAYLAVHPLCEECLEHGITKEAMAVDHIERFNGPDDPKRLDPKNLQALCWTCHSRKTATKDGGFGHERQESHRD